MLEYLFHKVERPAALLKRDFNTGVSVKFTKFLRMTILKSICGQLLLNFRSFWDFINPFHAADLFQYPLKGFLMFSAGIGRDQYHGMGEEITEA